MNRTFTDSLENAARSSRGLTATTARHLRRRQTAPHGPTFAELVNAGSRLGRARGPQAVPFASLLRRLALPADSTASELPGPAFTPVYRTANKYGGTVLYGAVLGFVVYVVTELANRSGYAGVLDPASAAAGPAFAAIFIGLTVLLYKEDGRA